MTGSCTCGEGASAATTAGCSISRNASPFRPLGAARARSGSPVESRPGSLSSARVRPPMIRLSGRNLARKRCRPERLIGSVLIELLAHWGYENDPIVVAEVLRPSRGGAPGRS